MRAWGRAVLLIGATGACGRLHFDPVDDGGILGGNGLALQAVPATINVGSRSMLVASGGVPPYTYRLEGAGTIVGTTFIAPTPAGQSIAHVDDSAGDTALATIDYLGQTLFVAGGDDGTITSSVLSSSDGGATWATVGNLPAARGFGALVVFDDKMFYAGGVDSADVDASEVYASTDGVTWTQVGNLPEAKSHTTGIVHGGEIWIVAGLTGMNNTADVLHSSDGITWTRAPGSITTARHNTNLVSRGGKLYALGGHTAAGFATDIQYTTDGSQWTTVPQTLTIAADSTAATDVGGLAMRVCGEMCQQAETSVDLATWTSVTPMPGSGGRYGPSVIGFGGHLLVVGGGQSVLSTVDGSSWTMVGNLPQSRTITAVVQFTPP